MSNTDSFIDEVNEEIQKDKFYDYLKKYGWIGIVVVFALVGGASWNEWSKSKAQAQAQANGDLIRDALSLQDETLRIEALDVAPIEGEAVIVKAMLEAGELYAAGDIPKALAILEPFTSDAVLDPIYRDLAILKTVMIGANVMTAEERISRLAGIAASGAPYRLLAEEQIAATQAEVGEIDVAIEGLRAISVDSQASDAMRQRAFQMIVALGGEPLGENQ